MYSVVWSAAICREERRAKGRFPSTKECVISMPEFSARVEAAFAELKHREYQISACLAAPKRCWKLTRPASHSNKRRREPALQMSQSPVVVFGVDAHSSSGGRIAKRPRQLA